MSWAAIEFAPRRHSFDVLMAVVAKDKTLGVSVLVSKSTLDALGWPDGAWVVPEIGLADNEGWLRLVKGEPGKPPARKLQPLRRSSSARVVMPVFPWMEQPEKTPSVEAEAKVSNGALLVKLPAWAALPVPDPPPPPTRAEAEAAAKQKFGVR